MSRRPASRRDTAGAGSRPAAATYRTATRRDHRRGRPRRRRTAGRLATTACAARRSPRPGPGAPARRSRCRAGPPVRCRVHPTTPRSSTPSPRSRTPTLVSPSGIGTPYRRGSRAHRNSITASWAVPRTSTTVLSSVMRLSGRNRSRTRPSRSSSKESGLTPGVCPANHGHVPELTTAAPNPRRLAGQATGCGPTKLGWTDPETAGTWGEHAPNLPIGGTSVRDRFPRGVLERNLPVTSWVNAPIFRRAVNRQNNFGCRVTAVRFVGLH